MPDNGTIAAILAAAMLSPIMPPATDANGRIGKDEQTRFVKDVLHAVGLYRAVLESLANPAGMRRLRSAEIEPAEPGRDAPSARFATAADPSMDLTVGLSRARVLTRSGPSG